MVRHMTDFGGVARTAVAGTWQRPLPPAVERASALTSGAGARRADAARLASSEVSLGGADVDRFAAELDQVLEASAFSGVVRVDRPGQPPLVRAAGDASRAHRIANRADTRFAIASGTKSFTAVTVLALVEAGVLALSTPARDLLGDDLPLIADDVTVEHLLSHRSGIGDYLDEEAGWDPNDHVLSVPAHELDATERYLAVLDGHPTTSPAGARFAYNNSGYVVLALLAERATGTPLPTLVERHVCRPAGLNRTGFVRTDALPGDVAVGYLDAAGLRTNVLHLPVLGSGDGGLVTTVDEVHTFWRALLAGRLLPPGRVEQLLTPLGQEPGPDRDGYGLGVWLPAGGVALEGSDPGISFRSVVDLASDTTHTVVSNTTAGAWPVARHLDALLPPGGGGT
jgi:CubicO group peptidase (beta-lactamase class C family)